MLATTERGTIATNDDLLARLSSNAVYSAKVSARRGAVHSLHALVDELTFISDQILKRRLEPEAVIAAIVATLKHEPDAIELCLDLYRDNAHGDAHLLVFASTRRSASPREALLLRRRSTPNAAPRAPDHEGEFIELDTVDGLVTSPAQGSLCFVANHRYFWPASPRRLSVVGESISLRLESLGMRSVRVDIHQDHLDKFDGAFLAQADGPRTIAGIDDVTFKVMHEDLAELKSAFAFGPWISPLTESPATQDARSSRN